MSLPTPVVLMNASRVPLPSSRVSTAIMRLVSKLLTGAALPDAGAALPDAGAVLPDAGAALPDAGALAAGAFPAGAWALWFEGVWVVPAVASVHAAKSVNIIIEARITGIIFFIFSFRLSICSKTMIQDEGKNQMQLHVKVM